MQPTRIIKYTLGKMLLKILTEKSVPTVCNVCLFEKCPYHSGKTYNLRLLN